MPTVGNIVGHGIDLVENRRIAEMLDAHGDRFVERCFTEAERRYADAARQRRVERYAARFAVKEAVLKALGTGWRDGIAWTDIELVTLPSGAPTIRLSGRSAEVADALGVIEWSASVSHTSDYAVASAIAIGAHAPGTTEVTITTGLPPAPSPAPSPPSTGEPTHRERS